MSTGARNDAVDLEAAREHGVAVWALILAAARNVAREDQRIREGKWQATIGFQLAGKTLGVIGLGRLGAEAAKIAHAFEMRVLAWSHAERAQEHGADLVGKDELLARSDVVTVHLRLSERTRDLIAAPELAAMKRNAWLVNTSRGPIVNEADLIAALEGRDIAGAALDVYDEEPLPADHPLRRLDNTVLTPHLGYVTTDTYRLFYGDAVEAVRAWIDRPIPS